VVECQLPKLDVRGSNPLARLDLRRVLTPVAPLKGIDPEFTPENLAKVRKKVEKELAPDTKLDAGAVARAASARRTFVEKRKTGELAEADRKNCDDDIDAAVSLLKAYRPLKPPPANRPMASSRVNLRPCGYPVPARRPPRSGACPRRRSSAFHLHRGRRPRGSPFARP
jgi:hypothetical protein